MATWIKTDPIRDRTAEEDFNGGTASEIQHYRVFFDGADANAADAVYAPGIPVKGQRLGTTACYVSRRSARQIDGESNVFIVEITYSTIPAQQQQKPEPRPANATKWNIDVSGSSVAWQEEIHEDRDGKPITNVNSEPVQPALTCTETDEQINVSFNTVEPDFQSIDECRGKCNDAPITLTLTTYKVTIPGDPNADPPTPDTYKTQTATITYPAESLKLDSTSWSQVYDGTDKVMKMNLVFLYKSDGWVEHVPNMSYYKRVDAGGSDKLAPITEKDIGGRTDNPVSQAQYIGGNGELLKPGDKIYKLDFYTVYKTSFATLLSEII